MKSYHVFMSATALVLSLDRAFAAPSERSLVHPTAWEHPSDGVAVSRSGIRMGSTVLRLSATEQQLVTILGAPDRRESGQNRLLVWDRLGIFAYQHPDRDSIDAIAVSFLCTDQSYCPRSPFPGVLVVDDAVFWHAPQPRDIVRYRFKADDFTCFRTVGKYRVSVDCIGGGLGLGTFELALKK